MTSNFTFPRSAFVGFDSIFDELDAIASRATDTYPPHSILKVDENSYLIEIAVAGFKEEELSVHVEDRSLTIKGKKDPDERKYLHKGISAKKFERKFALSENVEVNGATLDNGILSIGLTVFVPEHKKPKQIEIQKVTGPQLLTE